MQTCIVAFALRCGSWSVLQCVRKRNDWCD